MANTIPTTTGFMLKGKPARREDNFYAVGNDVFEKGTDRHIELPEFQKEGLNFAFIQPKPAPIPQYVRQKGIDEVYDVSEGLPRYVDYNEAAKNNIWKNIKENDYLYSPYKDVFVNLIKGDDPNYDNKFGGEGGYMKYGKPTTNVYIRKGAVQDKLKAIAAHELGHWFFKKGRWRREDYINNLGYEDTNDNDIITMDEKAASDYEAYRMGQSKDGKKIKMFKQLEKLYK